MGLKQKPFTKYNMDKTIDSFTVRLNEQERNELERCKSLIQQTKDSTCLKQLAWIGSRVIHEPQVHYIINTLFKNKRNNERLGINEFE